MSEPGGGPGSGKVITNEIAVNALTLRDYFAAQALPAVIAAMNQDVINRQGGHYTQNDIAAKSYIIADMMLAERAK